jgi:formylglycine-generating enzyme required for sulfatase activity
LNNPKAAMNKEHVMYKRLLFAAFILAALSGCSNKKKKTAGDTAAAEGVEKKTITNTIGMNLALIPAGEFMMGSPETEKERFDIEGPQHRVKITKAFYMGTTEVTQAQWKAVMGANPSHFQGDDFPVETVSWDDCQEFLKKLSAKEGKTYRLPTEAEWEYACRAGSTTRFNAGDDDNALDGAGWYGGNSENKTHPVGQKKPNAWGLYDMHGNVWEWCQDWCGEDYYKSSPTNDPAGPETSAGRVLRGGAWNIYPRSCRSAIRLKLDPGYRHYLHGFRVVMAP